MKQTRLIHHSISAAVLSVSLLGLSFSLAGRSFGEILNVTEAKIPPRQPKRILVANFDTSKGVFNVDESGNSLVVFEQNTVNRLADHLSKDITGAVVPATRENAIPHERGDVWLVTGEFIRVDKGGRRLPTLLGLSKPGKIQTVVRVYDLSRSAKEPFLQFETSANVKSEHGGFGPIGLIRRAIKNTAQPGGPDNTGATASEITSELAEYYSKGGETPSGKPAKPGVAVFSKRSRQLGDRTMYLQPLRLVDAAGDEFDRKFDYFRVDDSVKVDSAPYIETRVNISF